MRTVIEILKSIRPKDGLVMLLMLVGAFGLSKVFGQRMALLLLVLGGGVYLIRNHVDWWSSQVQQVLVVIFVVAFGVYLGRMIGMDKHWVVALLVGGIGLAIHFRRPEYMLLVAAVLVPNMFALIPAEFLQVRGLFKLRDLLLLGIVASVVVKELVQRRNVKFVFSSISSRGIIGFCFVVMLFMVFTSIRHSYPLSLSFRTGRDYFYYLFFFAVVHSLPSKKQLDPAIKALIGLSMLFAALYIVQALSGGSLHLLPAFPIAKKSVIWGVSLVRSYAPFGFAWPFCFGLLGIMTFTKSPKVRMVAATGSILILTAIFFTFGRTIWYKTVAIVILMVLLLPRERKKDFAVRIAVTLFAFGVFMCLIGMVRYGAYELLFKGLAERAYSGFTDIANSSGTYGHRRAVFISFYQAVIKRNLLFGIGFLYPRTELTQTMPYNTAVWVENPLACILNTMGIVGLLCHVLLYVVFVARGMFIFKRLRNPVYKGLIIGFIAWYIVDWLGIMTTAEMIAYDSITVKSLCVGLTECMYRADEA
jgi:hypothetical protein